MNSTDIWELIPHEAERNEYRARAALIDILAPVIAASDTNDIGERLGLSSSLVERLASRDVFNFASAQLAAYAWRLGLTPQGPVQALHAALENYGGRALQRLELEADGRNTVRIVAEFEPEKAKVMWRDR